MIPSDFIFSQSSLQSYKNCPRLFELLYLKHLAWPAQKYSDAEKYELDLEAGKILHQAICRYLLGFDARNILSNLEAGRDPRLPIWFGNFLGAFPELIEEPALAAEYSLTIPFQNYRLMAKFDCITLKDGGPIIYDWKSSAKKPSLTLLEASMQTKVYLTAASSLGEDRSKTLPLIRYWEANYPQLPLIIQSDENKLSQYRADLAKLIAEIEACEGFALTEQTKRCQYCKYRSYCKRGSNAGSTEDDAAFDLELPLSLSEADSET
ncbi:MAG: PD-(D/E)XK nuclease family protein [Anaerolineaceae bacterium]|nr:PD-(D/E)XK nuclease family protein [Anaerolineaceae bacterium]